MTTRKYSSRSQQSTLTGAITAGATSMTVVNGTTLLGGQSIPASTTFTLVIDPDTALEEIVDATAVSTNTFTITRSVDTVGGAQAHSAGAVVRHMAIGRDFRDANLHAEASGSYNDGAGVAHTMHGLGSSDGVVVGTLKEQTLTQKTLTSPTISNPTFTGTPLAAASISFEGATADDHETILTVVEPTADRSIELPNASGRIVLRDTADTLTNKTMGDALNAGGFRITNIATPVDATDAVNKTFADAQVAAAATSATSAATSASSASTSASSALTSANSASASASAAATSATSAATSASSAQTFASTMAASVTAAQSSATAAASSATAAATSATSAATSATSAAASATAAATSATSAAASEATAAASVATIAGYATTASNSASAAATSATSAATSATSASNSATASATSASAAATSATSAAASATAAATSATSAAASATAAATSATSAAASAASAAAAVAASFDAKGDLLVGTGASAFDQLTVAATNGYVLSVNSATATGLEWAAANPGDITGVTAGTGLSGGGTSGAVTVSLDTSSVYVVPAQAGNSGKYLTTNGTASSWGTVDALPSQTGNSGKYLTTNGTAAAWASIVTDPTPSVFMLMGA